MCDAKLSSEYGNLISCEGMNNGPKHKFYIKWNSNLKASGDSSRLLELAVATVDQPVGTEWTIDDEVKF